MSDLVRDAIDMRPLLREHAAQVEREHRLSPAVLEALHTAGAFRLQLGAAFGGPAAPPPTYLEALEEYCRGDGSSGWCAMVGTESAACVEAYLDPAVTREMLAAAPRAVVAFTVVGHGKAVATPDGYRVTGRWRFASGCRHADWLSALCVVHDGDQPVLRANGAPATVVFARASDVVLHDTWQVSGLRGTASDDFELRDIPIPASHTFDIAAPPRDPGAAWRLPLGVRLAMSKAAAVCGMARGAMDALWPLLDRTPFAGAKPAREEARVHSALAQAEASLEGGRAYLYRAVDTAWARARAGDAFSVEAVADLRLAIVWSARQAVSALNLMQDIAGTGAVLDADFDRAARDIAVARQHMQLQGHILEDVGRVRVGLPPRNPLF
ncbi:MAG: acyl-CoA dehydrogenase family protein [Gammaproteobacteria bacterium]